MKGTNEIKEELKKANKDSIDKLKFKSKLQKQIKELEEKFKESKK